MTEQWNPQMAVLAREAAGMSQKELAETAGISQGWLSKIENGLASPTSDDTDRLALALGVLPAFFSLSEEIVGLGSAMIFNRKRKTVGVRVERMAQAKINMTLIQVRRLLRNLDVHADRRFPQFELETFEGGEEDAAEHLRAAWRLPAGPVRDLTGVVESAGGVIIRCDLDSPKIDAAHVWIGASTPVFFLNENLSADRYRFTLAHEVAHAILHHFPDGDIEAEADAFAAALLMPARDIRHQLMGLTIRRAATLKSMWRVSIAAIIRRARDLSCISESRYTSLQRELSAMGYRRHEPVMFEHESPRFIEQVLSLHRNELGYRDDELSRLLLMRRPPHLPVGRPPDDEEAGGAVVFRIQDHLDDGIGNDTPPQRLSL